jgi:hypothetical protein
MEVASGQQQLISLLYVVIEMSEAFVPRILPFPRHFLTGSVQKPQKYCGLWLLLLNPVFEHAFFDKLFRANIVALAEMCLVEHGVVREATAIHRPAVNPLTRQSIW